MSVILYYFLYSFEAKCDGSPAILVLDEAWEISNIFPTEKDFDNWMHRMTKLNVVVILSTENLNLAFASEFTQYLDKHVDTRILMPNVNANRLYMKAFSLSKEELNIILQTPTQEGLFLIKQYKGLVTLNLDLKDMQEIHILSANKDTIKYMYKAIKEKGEEVSKWLPVFYEKCKA
jgi:type IV secretion system protein VirB4